MEKKTKYMTILIIFCFCVSILPATFGTFWSTTTSNHGKTVVITTKHVPSNLKESHTFRWFNGLEGLGNYTYELIWGKDDKNNNMKQNITHFNGNVIMFGSIIYSGDHYFEKLKVKSSISTAGKPSTIGLMNGYVGLTSYTGFLEFPYKMMKDPRDGVLTSQMSDGKGLFKLYYNKTYYGQTNYSITSKQTRNISTYVEKFVTKYKIGTKRTSIITTSYYRNTTNNNYNTIKVTSTGKSYGTDIINHKIVGYIGTVNISYKLNPKNKKYTFNSYKEVKKSNSKSLTSRIPVLEVLINKPWMNS
jgi:hypothetical protein